MFIVCAANSSAKASCSFFNFLASLIRFACLFSYSSRSFFSFLFFSLLFIRPHRIVLILRFILHDFIKGCPGK
uniref:Uncharacterized protein n=3 Tax=Vibrio TaxID=662 RepID=A0A0H3ZYY1_9VIBR|nr:hypothetical protein [Vibrio sp. ZF_53]AKN36065.1 hypothetical protein [Vibrio sp. ZF_53]AKN37817.1 hypothetical protein [Vibrio sp. ZF_45]AKN39832.1 hypothetical protein [Vibrio tasmaniensis]